MIDGLLGVNDVRVEPVYLGWCRFKPFYYGVRLVSLLYQFGKEVRVCSRSEAMTFEENGWILLFKCN